MALRLESLLNDPETPPWLAPLIAMLIRVDDPLVTGAFLSKLTKAWNEDLMAVDSAAMLVSTHAVGEA